MINLRIRTLFIGLTLISLSLLLLTLLAIKQYQAAGARGGRPGAQP